MKNTTKFKMAVGILVVVIGWRLYVMNFQPTTTYKEGYSIDSDSSVYYTSTVTQYKSGEKFDKTIFLDQKTKKKVAISESGTIYMDSLYIQYNCQRDYAPSIKRMGAKTDSSFKAMVFYQEGLKQRFSEEERWTWNGKKMIKTKVIHHTVGKDDAVNEIVYNYSMEGILEGMGIWNKKYYYSRSKVKGDTTFKTIFKPREASSEGGEEGLSKLVETKLDEIELKKIEQEKERIDNLMKAIRVAIKHEIAKN
jgi:hypothetical protein